MSKTANPKRKALRSREAEAFGKVLHRLRTAKGLSQEELGFRSETNRTYISDMERGNKEPCLTMLFRISRALETAPSLLFKSLEAMLKS
ncbi:MAG: putative transcriptional regulator [Edaphobacter sp.]|nr:putative transcriptional regulator [Edaphobacter sp.]